MNLFQTSIKWRHLSLFIGLLLCTPQVFAWCLIMPEEKAPYFSIINTIAENIQLELPDSQRIEASARIPKKCFANTENGFILLGPGAYQRMAKLLKPDQINIAVAVEKDKNIEHIDSWFQYIPSPKATFENLKKIEPSIQTIHILVDDLGNKELINQAAADLELLDKKLTIHHISAMQNAPATIEKIIENLDSNTEALWLSPHFGQYRITSLLPLIIKASLKHEKMTIANNLSWIDKGLFFGVYPDNVEFGKQVGKTIQSHSTLKNFYIESVLIVMNEKTIRFLKRNPKAKNYEQVNLFLPKN